MWFQSHLVCLVLLVLFKSRSRSVTRGTKPDPVGEMMVGMTFCMYSAMALPTYIAPMPRG